MPQSHIRDVLSIAGMMVAANFVASSALADDGEKIFKKQCGACHTIEKDGKRRQGPNLYGTIGRKLGSVEKFPYSKGLKNDDRVWDETLLDQWLTDPKSVHKDSYMAYKQADPEIRAAVIAYVKEFGEGG